jgi:hypothetical protein
MIGIAAMGFVSSLTVLMFAVAEFLFLSHRKQAGVVICHAATLFYHINISSRNCLLATLSIIVFIVIKYGHQKIKILYLNIALVVVVLVVILLGLPYFFPSAVNNSFQIDGVICLPSPRPPGYVGIGLAVAITDIPTRIIAIGVVIASIVFVKKHGKSLAKEKRLKIAMVKFTGLLVILNIVVFVATYIALAPFLFLSSFQDHLGFKGLTIFRQLIDLILPSLPPIVTPLMMMAVFKPLQTAIKRIGYQLCCESMDSPSEETQTTSIATV